MTGYAAPPQAPETAQNPLDRLASGGSFLFDETAEEPAIWGDGDRVLWAEGESLMVYSSPGVGKTTLAGLLVRARLGLDADVLGMPVAASGRRVLYLAQDRPRQIARAMRRQFDPSERERLDDRLVVWRGPLLEDLAANPRLFASLAEQVGAGTIIVDSIKDAASRLAEDEGGRAYNVARQHALAAEVEVLELHHARKASGEGRRSLSIDDVYGSTWLTAGAGSVVALVGDPADSVVELQTMRAPRGEVRMSVEIDRDAGTMRADTPRTAIDALNGQGSLIARSVAAFIYGHDEPTKAEEARTRRELERLVKSGDVEKVRTKSPRGGHEQAAYRLNDGSEAVS